MKRKAISTLGAAVALALYGGQAAHAQCTVTAPDINEATPFQAGPVNPNNGFAEFVTDTNQLSLELCLDPAFCFFDPVVAGNLFSEQIGFGAEAFWWLSEAAIDTPTGLSAIIVMAAEAAFLTEDPAPGDQFPFTRLRIRMDVPVPGVYTVTHPYGIEKFTVPVVGAGQEVRTSQDIEFVPALPPATSAQNDGCVAPWLAWDNFLTDPVLDTTVPPDGIPDFIGDGATPHTVTGGPNGNVFQISAAPLNAGDPPIDLDGAGNSTVSTDLFIVNGKLYDGQLATPMVVDRTTYERADTTTGQVDVFTTGAETAEVTFNGGPNLPAGPIPLIGGEPLLPESFFASVGLVDGAGQPDASVVPPLVEINATDVVPPLADPASDPTRLLRLVTDVVTILRAEYNVGAVPPTLTVEAVSSDALQTASLTVAEYGLPVPAQVETDAPPARVSVFSTIGGVDSAQVAVINNVPPVAVNDSVTTDEDTEVTFDVTTNDTDADDIDPTSVVITSDTANGTAVNNGDGTITYTPNADFNGGDSLTYTVEDTTGILSNEATMSITVNAVNDAPVAVDDADSTTVNIAKVIDVLANDTDVDNVPPAAPNAGLSVTAFTQPANGSVTSDGTNVTYTPNPGFTGLGETFTYTVSDGTLTDTATVTVDVFNVNNPPTANPDSFTVDEDSGTTTLLIQDNGLGGGVLANDTDPDGDTLTITAVTQPANGSVVNNGSNVSFTPELNFNGSTSFTYTITDGNGDSDSAGVTVNVTPVNDDQTALGDSAATTFDTTTGNATPVTIDVLGNDSDIDGDTLTVAEVSDPTRVRINIDDTVTYTPTAAGAQSFTYTASDGNGGLATATVNVNVSAVSGLVDLDIDQFRVRGGGGTITLRVRNNGGVNAQRPATVVGFQGNTQVYIETRQVSDALGGGATTFNFTGFAGAADSWTATIVDDNVDLDQATQ